MVVDLSPIWQEVSDAFLGNKCPFGLTWVLCWEEEEESLENDSFVLILDHLGEEEENV